MPEQRSHLVLIIDDHEWSSRSLESVLVPAGYTVSRAPTAARGLKQAHANPPDIIFIGHKLPNSDAVILCRTFRDDRQFGPGIPILIFSSERSTRKERIAVYEAGAWEFVSYPIDVVEFLPRLRAYVVAKSEIDRARERSLIDWLTGLYNVRGLEQRAQEIQSMAHRKQQAVGCIVLSPIIQTGNNGGGGGDEEEAEAAVERVARRLKEIGRESDATGRLGRFEIAILAPDTNQDGIVKMAERLAAAIPAPHAPDVPGFLAGYDVVPDMSVSGVRTSGLLARAAQALQWQKRDLNGGWIRAFETGGTASA